MYKIILFLTTLLFFFNCGPSDKGTLEFKANGEDFVREGFIDKDGWEISFDKLFVNLGDVKAFTEDEGETKICKTKMIDLAAGDENAEPIKFGEAVVEPGNYKGLQFSLKKANDGEHKGFSIIMIGKAERGEKKVDFTIKLDHEVGWMCHEGFVGDTIKGIVKKGKVAEVEMTFHFDHIFGNGKAPKEGHVNKGAVGFEYFNKFEKDGKLNIVQQNLAFETDRNDYKKLLTALDNLGHTGEGHCKKL